MIMERTGFMYDPRDMLLSLQIDFSFVKPAVAFEIPERIACLEPSSETSAPRYSKLGTQLLSFYLNLLVLRSGKLANLF